MVFLQGPGDKVATVAKFITREYNGEPFTGAITTGYRSMSDCNAPYWGRAFFEKNSASFAASKYTREAVPSIVGSFVL